MSEDTEELFELAIKLTPYTEKHRVKRTQDTFDAILKLKDYQEKIQLTLDKLTSGNILSEKDADVLLNFNVPEVSSLIRPHATERQWKVRYDKARKIIRKGKASAKLDQARAFLKVFTTKVSGKFWGTKVGPNEAWYEYFKSVYRTSVDEE